MLEKIGINVICFFCFLKISMCKTSEKGKKKYGFSLNCSVNCSIYSKCIFASFLPCTHGYRTLYVEDHPDIAIFDFGKSGFQIPPGDYFNRHFTIAMENTNSIWDTAHYCVHGRKEANIHDDDHCKSRVKFGRSNICLFDVFENNLTF
jgi:hypothetical protein